MDEAIKTFLQQYGPAAVLLVFVVPYFLKKEVSYHAQQKEWKDLLSEQQTEWQQKLDKQQTEWQQKLDDRHKEVLALTERSIAAIVKFDVSIEECKDIIAKCHVDTQRRGA